jgi:tetratricopeptide (TPR) repeat protein
MFWRKKERQNDEAALAEVIDSIMSGKVIAQEGAKKLKSFLGYAISLGNLNDLAVQMSNQGMGVGALRLAETNMILAEEQKEESYKVQCACTLAQFLSGDRRRIEERWQLLEYAVPELLEWGVSGQIKGTMLAHLADARFNACNNQPSVYASVVEAVEQALTYENDIVEPLLGRLYFIGGTALDDLGENEKTLAQSVRYLEGALQYYTLQKYPDEYASTLNNLGNSYKHLGMLKNDRKLLEKAIKTYDEALPYRASPQLKLRTQNNRKEAVELLEKLASHKPLPRKAKESTDDQHIRVLLRAGDESFFAAMQKGDGNEGDRQAAAEKYLEASRSVKREANPGLRAEIYHRLASLFLREQNDDPLWTSYCFANATKRLAQGNWQEVSQARVTMHQGEALTIIGFPDHEGYLQRAEELLRTSLPVMKAQGHPGESEECNKYLSLCLSFLATRGDSAHTRKAQEFFAEGESARLEHLDRAITSHVKSRDLYERYAKLVKRIAPDELKNALGAIRAEGAASVVDQHVDEFNHASMLIEVAQKYLALGELAGALETVETAEEFAADARFSAPSIWCELAMFYASIPMTEKTHQCLNIAQSKMELAAQSNVAVLPGDRTGRWIPEYGLDAYQDEIDATKRKIGNVSAASFDPARTAELLCPQDAARRRAIQGELETNVEQFK